MDLLERTAELGALANVTDEVAAGSGRIVLIEGPPGIGKSALVRAARSGAAERGLEALTARGAELETEFAFGVVRQLFERRLAATEPQEFESLFSGAASLAAGLFSFGRVAGDGPSPPEDRFALLHGLYWLAAGLAARGPLALLVDDAHWSDEPSLQWLGYLARRIEDLPVMIVLAARSTEPEAPVPTIDLMRTEPNVFALQPSPLSPDAASALLSEVFGKEPQPAFTGACHGATGGNPFLLTELAQSLAADGVSPTEAGGALVEATAPTAIAAMTVVRLGHLAPAAQAMAVAAAVLGDGCELRDAAALAELDEHEAIDAADTLTAAGFLARGLPLRFQHPLLRSAIYRDIAAADRASRHKRAAILLRDRGAPPERIAAHLLLCEPAGDEWVVGTLMNAGATAMERGTPRSTISYLQRALAEDLPGDRPHLLFALGAAEAQALEPEGVEHLREALELAAAPPERVEAARVLALLLVRLGRVEDAAATLSAELAALPREAAETHLELEADLAAILHWGRDEAVDLLDATLAEAPRELTGETPGERSLLASRAFRAAKAGHDADLVARDALRALEAGLLDDRGPAAPAWASAGYALVATDDPSAWHWLEEAMRRSRATGSRFGASLQANLMSIVAFREGNLADAEAFAWETVEIVRGQQETIGLPASLSALVDALSERGRADSAWAEIARDGFDVSIPHQSLSAFLCESRGRLRLVRHDVEGALADALEAGDLYRRWGATGPTITRWRSSAAEAYALLGRRAEARTLADEDLDAARRFGRPRPIGIALRALGLALDGDDAIERLEQAVEVLAPSRAKLEHARALCDLGAALRRANRRREAREALSEALDLATRCGALTLAERASDELRATGARPRRVLLSGVESLTASELRVARLAAEGLSNREIAQQLFLSIKTIEMHLGRVYRKLEIKSREELAGALA